MSEVQGRPTIITAAEFMEQGYAPKVAAEECKVFTWRGYEVERITLVKGRYHVTEKHDHVRWHGVAGDSLDKFTVRWLIPQPATDPIAPMQAESDWNVDSERQNLQSALQLNGFGWSPDNSCATNASEAILTLRAERDAAKAEAAALRQQVAAQQAQITRLWGAIADYVGSCNSEGDTSEYADHNFSILCDIASIPSKADDQ